MHQHLAEKAPAPAAPQRTEEKTPEGPDTAQVAAQQGYLQALRGPDERAARPAAPPPQEGGKKKEESGGFWGRVGGWFSKAADWVGEKAVAAKDAAVAGYDYVAEKASSAWETTKQVATDTYDVLTSTDLSYQNGTLSGTTDAAEVMDLMPARYRDAMAFDKRAKNDVTVAYDTKTGIVTASASTLALSKLALGPLTAGPTTLTDVVITLANPKGGVPVLDNTADNLQATIHVGGVSATEVVYAGPQGELKVQSVVLAGLDAQAFNPGGGVPMADGTKDHLAGTFALESAVLRGVSGDAVEAGEVAVEGVRGGVDQDAESAWATVGSAQARQARVGDTSVEQAQVRGARLGVDNTGGGAPLLDSTPDQPKLAAQVESASVDGLRTAQGTVGHADVAGVSGHYDVATGDGAARVDQASARDVDLAGVKVAGAQAEGLQAARAGSAHSASATSLAVQGADSEWGGADAARVQGLEARFDAQTGDAALQVQALEAQKARGAGASADALRVEGLAAQRDAETTRAQVGAAQVTGLDAGAVGGNLSVTDARAETAPGDRLLASAAQVKGDHLKVGDATVGAAEVEAAYVGRNAEGAWGAGAKSAAARDVRAGDVAVGAARAEGLRGDLAADGAASASVDRASATNLRAGDASVGAAQVTGLRGGRDAEGGLHGSADRASVERVRARENAVGSAQVTGVRGGRGADGGLRGALDEATLTDAQVGGARVGEASVRRVEAARDAAGVTTASAAELRARDLTGPAAAETLAVDGLAARLEGNQGSASAERVAATSVQAGDVSLAEGQVDRLRVSGGLDGQGRAQIGGAQARDLKVGDQATVGAARAEGIEASRRDGAVAARADRLHAEAVDTQWADAGAVDVQGAQVGLGADGTRARVDALDVERLAAGPVTADAVGLRDAGVAVDAEGGVRTDAQAVSAADLRAPGFQGRALEAHGVRTRHDAAGHEVAVQDAAVTGADLRSGRYHGSAERAFVDQTRVSVGRDGDFSAAAGKVGVQGVDFDVAGRDLDDPGTTGGGYVSTGQVVRGLAPRVQALDANFTAPLKPGEIKGLGVDEGTDLSVEVQARDNKLVPGHVSAEVDQPLDAPAWIGVRGVHLREHRPRVRNEDRPRFGKESMRSPRYVDGPASATEGKLDADVTGWFDQDITGKVNGALGRDGEKTLPLSLGTLGALTADRIDAARDAGRGPDALPEEKVEAQNPIDMDRYALDARVQLSPGEIDLGGKQHVEVARGAPGANQMNVRGRGGEDLVFDMVNLVLGSMNLQVGEKKFEADGAEVKQAQLNVGENAERATTFDGSIGSFEAQGLTIE
ncbi:MAG: hypothetical protein H6704_13125 [Myxococcales bacterium]|nr:hypothetical protein [Myxococcales bacterium]